jgi:hypothetical protein
VERRSVAGRHGSCEGAVESCGLVAGHAAHLCRITYLSLRFYGSGRYELLTGGGRGSVVANSSGLASSAPSPSRSCPSTILEANIYFSHVDFVEDASDVGASISDKEDKEDDLEGGALTFGLGIAGVATAFPIFPMIFSFSDFSLLFSASGDARASLVHPKLPDSYQDLDRCLRAWVAKFFNCSNCGQEECIIVDATNVASAGMDVSDGSIAPTTEDRLRLAIMINCDPNREYRVQEKVALEPGKANGTLN